MGWHLVGIGPTRPMSASQGGSNVYLKVHQLQLEKEMDKMIWTAEDIN